MDRSLVKVLIVDDVATIRTKTVEILRQAGFTSCQQAPSVPEAQKFISENKYQLILCDRHMAYGDGLQLLKFVRRQPLDDCLFIMVTAEATKEFVIEAVVAGVDDYVLKPLTSEHTEKIIKKLTERKVLT